MAMEEAGRSRYDPGRMPDVMIPGRTAGALFWTATATATVR